MRWLHWSLVGVMPLAWWTGSSTSLAHELLGYAAAAIVVARCGWSRFGSHHARFRSFVRGPVPTLGYARAVVSGRAPRYLGHNPLGAWMVLALLANTAAIVLTGWLYTTDWLWGYGWLAMLHNGLAWLWLGLVVLHVGGVLLTSWQHRENLIGAMWSGRKRRPGPDDVA